MNHQSLWESKHFSDFDVIIVGAGLTGMATAISLLESTCCPSGGILPKPSLKVAILERYLTPSGASSKNAGFTLYTEFTEFLDDIKNMGEQKAIEILIKRFQGHEMLIKRILKLTKGSSDFPPGKGFVVEPGFTIEQNHLEKNVRNGIQTGHIYSNNGFFEIISEKEEASLKQIDYANKLLYPHFKQNVFRRCDHKIEEFGFDSKHVRGMVETLHCGSIDSGAFLKLLIQYASYLGASLFTNTSFQKYETRFNGTRNLDVQVECLKAEGFSSRRSLSCDKLVFCTNSFTKHHFPNEKIVPGRGQIFLTKSIKNLNLNGTFGYDEGYYYFKNIGPNRILIGGGRNEDFAGEETFKFGNSEKILSAIRESLGLVLGRPPKEIEIDRTWSGIMAFSPDKSEYRSVIVKKHSPHVFIGARLGGMGISLSSSLGQELAGLVLEDLRVKPRL